MNIVYSMWLLPLLARLAPDVFFLIRWKWLKIWRVNLPSLSLLQSFNQSFWLKTCANAIHIGKKRGRPTDFQFHFDVYFPVRRRESYLNTNRKISIKELNRNQMRTMNNVVCIWWMVVVVLGNIELYGIRRRLSFFSSFFPKILIHQRSQRESIHARTQIIQNGTA